MYPRLCECLVVVAAFLYSPGCDPPDLVEVGETKPQASPQEGYVERKVENGGSIRGIVTLKDDPPPIKILTITADVSACGRTIESDALIVSPRNKGVKNAIVSITNIASGKEIVTEDAVLDRRNCMFVPHVLVIQAGTTVWFKNSHDPISHMPHFYSKTGLTFNELLPAGRKVSVVLNEPELIRVKADVHPWMSAWIVVKDNPYWSVTDEAGGFEIDDIPEGTYKVKYWHESLRSEEKEITVRAKQSVNCDVTLLQKKGRRRRK